MKKKTSLAFTPETLRMLQELAKADSSSMQHTIEMLIRREFDKRFSIPERRM